MWISVEDFTADNVKEADGTDGLCVNRHVVNESRIMLFEVSWQKYREGNANWQESI